MPKKAVTIRDVARHAGVSVATASRALNGKSVVNARTRDRILTVMDELGFRPSPADRATRTNSTDSMPSTKLHAMSAPSSRTAAGCPRNATAPSAYTR